MTRSMSEIRPVRAADAATICDIYNHHVRDTIVTFEEAVVGTDEMAVRVADVTRSWPWLVAEVDGAVVGYAYAAAWKARSAFRFSVESAVYVAQGSAGRGIGTALYRRLMLQLKERGVHCVIGGISLPNAASVALHEKIGFRKVGQFDEVGFKLGRWVAVGYWQLLL